MIIDNLKKLNVEIPDAPDPVGAYVAYKVTKNLLYISGQLPIDSNGKIIKGKVGKDLKDQGYTIALLETINNWEDIKQSTETLKGLLEQVFPDKNNLSKQINAINQLALPDNQKKYFKNRLNPKLIWEFQEDKFIRIICN